MQEKVTTNRPHAVFPCIDAQTAQPAAAGAAYSMSLIQRCHRLPAAFVGPDGACGSLHTFAVKNVSEPKPTATAAVIMVGKFLHKASAVPMYCILVYMFSCFV